mgnify:CR=1 FL=1
MEGGFLWPEPLIQLNPAFEPGPSLQDLINRSLELLGAKLTRPQEQVAADVKIVVAGESLGGALAALLSVRMQQQAHPHRANWAGYFEKFVRHFTVPTEDLFEGKTLRRGGQFRTFLLLFRI